MKRMQLELLPGEKWTEGKSQDKTWPNEQWLPLHLDRPEGTKYNSEWILQRMEKRRNQVNKKPGWKHQKLTQQMELAALNW